MQTPGSTPKDVEVLLKQAEQALAQGSPSQAEALLSRAAQLAPDHAAVLNALGLQELRRGNILRARELIERGLSHESGNIRLLMNLAGTLRRLGLADEEMNTLDRVLALEPRNTYALLQKGALLELQGKRKAAARVYQHAIQTIRPGTQIPQVVAPLMEKAAQAIKANDRALDAYLQVQLSELRAQHAHEDQERFDHCIDTILGRRTVFTPQPTFLHFPKVPAWEFYQRSQFPWLEELEAGTAEVRAELEKVLAQDAQRLEPYIAYPDGVPLDQWAELNHSRRWSVFFLWRDGKPVHEHIERCPNTARLLRKMPMLDVRGYAPAAFFSILDAKSRIPPHVGVTNTRLIVHLPLIIPGSCRFRVGSQTREWQPGRAWVFDDTIEHEAVNDSEVPRAILIFDIWNPYLSPGERDLVRRAVEGIKDYYQDEAQIRTSS